MEDKVDEIKEKLKTAVSTWIRLAADANKSSARLFKAEPEDKCSEWIDTIVSVFDGDTDSKTFDFSYKSDTYTVTPKCQDGYVVLLLSKKAKKRPKTPEEWKQWWIDNNPHMLDEPPKPVYDNAKPKSWSVY